MKTGGRRNLNQRFGTPEPGHTWCSGYRREPHQIPIAEASGVKGRCKACKAAYMQHYKEGNTGAAGHYERLVNVEMTRAPGNSGRLNLPQWGYRCA